MHGRHAKASHLVQGFLRELAVAGQVSLRQAMNVVLLHVMHELQHAQPRRRDQRRAHVRRALHRLQVESCTTPLAWNECMHLKQCDVHVFRSSVLCCEYAIPCMEDFHASGNLPQSLASRTVAKMKPEVVLGLERG